MSDKLELFVDRISDDKQSVSINLLPASGASGTLDLTLDRFTRLIQSLGEVRSRMVFGQKSPPLEEQKVSAVVDTRWLVQPVQLLEGSVLTFYHPSFGTMGFVVPRDQVSVMVRLLTNHLEIKPAAYGKLN